MIALVTSRLLRIPGDAFVAAVNGNALGSGGSATAGIVGRVANPVADASDDLSSAAQHGAEGSASGEAQRGSAERSDGHAAMAPAWEVQRWL